LSVGMQVKDDSPWGGGDELSRMCQVRVLNEDHGERGQQRPEVSATEDDEKEEVQAEKF
jgi:hypothetical protein